MLQNDKLGWLLELLKKRDGQMYGYYKSTFEDDYEGGYPIAWDEEFIKSVAIVIQEERAKERAENRSLAMKLFTEFPVDQAMPKLINDLL